MCRLAAYLGPPLGLDAFLSDPPHGLVAQAHAPRETLSATLNADGFGFGWYDDAGRPAVYRSTLPAWGDPNLPHLGRSLERNLWLANVRSATDPLSNGYANTQPFHDDALLFLHNGFVDRFDADLRGRLRRWLRSEIESGIAGTTDSEYLFAALRQLRAQRPGDPLEAHVKALLGHLAEWLGDTRALLNLAVSDGQRVVAVRHALNAESPSLYLHAARADSGGALIASEPFDDDHAWQPVPPGAMVLLEADGHARIEEA